MIEILIVDDHALMRDLLRERLQAQEGLSVRGVAGDAREALRLARELRPDVVVMDIHLPGADGIETARQIRASGLEPAILCLTMSMDMAEVERALSGPVDGYAVKNDSFAELVEAIRTVARGERYLSPRLARSPAVLEAWKDQTAEAPEHPGAALLTARELQVISLVAAGLEKREIAEQLGISERTVDAHRAHIADKTGMRRIAELTRFAVRRNLV
jgi:two-component system response regulator NreC